MSASAGVIPERLLNIIAGAGLLALLAYGFISWKASGEAFPADMRGSTLEIQERGFLRAGMLGASAGRDPAGERAVVILARRLRVQARWVDLPASEMLRKLAADSLDVVADYDASLPGAEAFGLTRPYAELEDSRLVLAVPAGENRLLRLADEAVRSAR